MLYLDNSAASCLPLMRTKSAPKGVSALGGRCEACAIEVPCGLEKHEGKVLCPFCHLTQHLYEASRLRAGRIIWLPKIGQADLNRFVVTMFMLLKAPESHKAAVAATLNKMKSIYQEGFEQDCALPYEQFLRPEEPAGNAGARKRPMVFPFPLNDPLILANGLDAARAAGKLARKEGANAAQNKKATLGEPATEGLRLLFSPRPFAPLLDAWRADFFARRPPEHWLIEPKKDDTPQA